MVRPIFWVDEKFPFPLVTLEQNYWLGLLMCDGYVQRANKSAHLGLELSDKDAYLVSRFGLFVGAKAHSSRRRVRVLRACSRETHLLARHGIVPNKTGKEKWPESVTDTWAFLRGVLDGDGTVGCYNKRSLQLGFVSASQNFLESINAKLYSVTGSDASIRISEKGTSYRIDYSLGYDKARSLYGKLYSDPREPRLHRKERIIRVFSERPRPKIGRPKHS